MFPSDSDHYVNFFTHHFLPDIRLLLFAAVVVLFLRTWIFYRIDRAYRSMPLLLSLVLVSLFIWFAENIGTVARAWTYPHQARGWVPVGPEKLGAWAADQRRDGGSDERGPDHETGSRPVPRHGPRTGRCFGRLNGPTVQHDKKGRR